MAPLASWNDGAAKEGVLAFVERVSAAGIPPSERVAVFDNDGTLWCEKPLPIQADFILRRLYEMAEADPALRDKQPWKAAFERDYAWLGQVMVEHYAGDDTNVRTLLGGVIAAHAGISVDDFEQQADTFLRTAQHPTLGRGYLACAYAPMVELLRYLDEKGVLELHRLRRRPRLHAPDQRRDVRHPA
jgi:FMN phosphatase YigB (HAD superfamily)